MELRETRLSRKEIFKGHVFSVAVDTVALPNNAGEATREIVTHRGAVAILAVTSGEKIVLVKQYRHAVEAVSLEIPAGKIEEGEEERLAEAALRELEEETGYTSQEARQIHKFYTAIGFCNERLTIFQAGPLIKVANPRPLDDGEFVEILEVGLEEALAMIADGRIEDSKTIIAIQYYALEKART